MFEFINLNSGYGCRLHRWKTPWHCDGVIYDSTKNRFIIRYENDEQIVIYTLRDGDIIVINPFGDQWVISQEYFERNYIEPGDTPLASGIYWNLDFDRMDDHEMQVATLRYGMAMAMKRGREDIVARIAESIAGDPHENVNFPQVDPMLRPPAIRKIEPEDRPQSEVIKKPKNR